VVISVNLPFHANFYSKGKPHHNRSHKHTSQHFENITVVGWANAFLVSSDLVCPPQNVNMHKLPLTAEDGRPRFLATLKENSDT